MNERAALERAGVVMATTRAAGPHLTVAGELDAPGAVRLRAQLDDLIEPGVHLTLDLSRVRHLSMDAVHVLVNAHRRLRDGAGSLALDGVSPSVVRVLRTSGLDRALTVRRPATSPATSARPRDEAVAGP